MKVAIKDSILLILLIAALGSLGVLFSFFMRENFALFLTSVFVTSFIIALVMFRFGCKLNLAKKDRLNFSTMIFLAIFPTLGVTIYSVGKKDLEMLSLLSEIIFLVSIAIVIFVMTKVQDLKM